MKPRDKLPPINFGALAAALLPRAYEFVSSWLPGGVQRGHEYFCGSVNGGDGDSFAVNLTSGKWSDFATGEAGGDLVSLYAAANNFAKNEMGKAAVQLAREEGLESVAGVLPAAEGGAEPVPRPKPAAAAPAAPKADLEKWKTLLPVPPHAQDPPPTFWHYHRNNERRQDPIDHTATYKLDGQLLGYVVRFLDSTGEKETLPYTWCISERDGTCKWHWRHWDEPRPLYIPSQTLPKGRTVVIVEGEKKADVLQAALEAHAPGVYLVVSWPGGSNAWKKASWTWLEGATVLLWPDCDSLHEPLTKAERDAVTKAVTESMPAVVEGDAAAAAALKAEIRAAVKVEGEKKPYLPREKQPGLAAMLGIGARLAGELSCTVQILPCPAPGTLPSGWDCADAINTDGWDGDRILAFFAQAAALPTGDNKGAAAGGGGGAKPPAQKDPAGAGDDDDGEGTKINGKVIPWWLQPYYDHDKCRWLTSRKLVIMALKHDPNLNEVLGLNQLSNNIDARVAWPWEHGKAGPITGAVDLMLGDYLTRTYGLPSIARAALMEAIETVAHGNPFHPIRLWLATLKHGGKKRIDTWLIYALGETPESLDPAVFEYLQLLGRYWLLGMVNRVMHPGCKFDYCPVLEGPGGYRKSTLVEALAGAEYFSDTHFDVARGKEGQEQVQGLWMYEIAELANFGKAEIGLIKAFISGKSDRYRPSYGRVVEKFDRQCVLAGTTNESTYLRDRTGNRRFWPVPVRNRINIDWILKYRDELFAEAYALYLTGAQFTPSPADEKRLFVPMQESRLVESAVLSELLHVLTRPTAQSGMASIVNTLTDFVTMSQLTLALGVDAAKSSPALESQIRSWLEHEGWLRAKKQINGARAWGYIRPDKWPPQETDDKPDMQTVMAAGMSPAKKFIEEDADDAPF